MAKRQQQEDASFTAEQLDSAVDLPDPLKVLKAAVDRVRADVATTTGLRLPYFLRGPGHDGEYECGPGLLVTFWPGDDIEAFVAAVADEQSEWVSETLAELGNLERARTWPICPRHNHSINPALEEGVAVWQCRDDPSVRVRIGKLTSP